MVVAKNKVVTLDYELKSAEGEILDSSEENGSLSYIHGTGFLIPGLEKALEGKTLGDSVNEVFSPEEAYGQYDDNLLFKVSTDDFDKGAELYEGLEFQAEVADQVRICTIVSIEGKTVTVDANHPLSGEELHVKAKILGIRDASAEELDHGHVHDGSEHHHH